jgi:hypothetical protein
MEMPHQCADAVCFFVPCLRSSLGKGLSVGQSQQSFGSPHGINAFAPGFDDPVSFQCFLRRERPQRLFLGEGHLTALSTCARPLLAGTPVTGGQLHRWI